MAASANQPELHKHGVLTNMGLPLVLLEIWVQLNGPSVPMGS